MANSPRQHTPTTQKWRAWLPIVGVLTGVVVSVGALGAWLVSQLEDEVPKSERVVQIRVLPPPPPPPLEEPPPPPPPEEEVEIPEPEQLPNEPELANAANESLGLDAEGSAGGDAFGLQARRGGADITGQGDSSHRWYAGQIRDQIQALLADNGMVKGQSYRVPVLLWVSIDGALERYELLGSTGNAELDSALQNALTQLGRFNGAPPVGMPNPIRLRIESRA